MIESQLIVALDYPELSPALKMADQLDPQRCRLKVGKELFTRCGPQVLNELHKRHFEVFLDLKYHDIPHTVGRACAAAADLGVWMLNVHTLGGSDMLEAARNAVGNQYNAPLLIGVTLLTSMDARTFAQIGLSGTIEQTVLNLAKLAAESGLDGVVCSAHEAKTLKQQRGGAFKLVTPGIRPAGSVKADQHRTMTPREAISAGSDYLVIGRPITSAAEPMLALVEIEQSL